jgi:hypothetical protein
MSASWEPAIPQTMQQHGGRNRTTTVPKPAVPAPASQDPSAVRGEKPSSGEAAAEAVRPISPID